MLEIWLGEASTEALVKVVNVGLDYEKAMEREIAEGQDVRPHSFLPAAKVAYERVLNILCKPMLVSSDYDAVHAEMAAVYEQPHYDGIGLFFVSDAVDLWLAAVDGNGVPRPLLTDLHRAKRLPRTA